MIAGTGNKNRTSHLSLSQSRTQAAHSAFCRAMPYAAGIAGADGRILAWNDEASRLTGIDPHDALSFVVWDVLGRIAPAHLPYEVAVKGGHDRFQALLREMVDSNGSSRWVRHGTGVVLSTFGVMSRCTFDLFPLWIDQEPAVVGIVTQTERVSDAQHPEVYLQSG